MTIITSKDNNRIKKARKLLKKKYRTNSYLVEGWHLLDEALAQGVEVRQIFVEEAYQERVAHLPHVLVVTREVLASLSEVPSPQGVIAELAFSPVETCDLSKGRWLLLEEVQDPGNVGTMIRTGDAAGITGVLLTSGCADIYNQKTLRAMQGSHFHLPIYRMPLSDILDGLALPLLASTLSQTSVDYRNVSPGTDFILAMGNEGQGISTSLAKASSQLVHIPMPGQAESLNVAIACGILLFSYL
ncbi:TrmH family RNA methyltransferase [Streptococcus sp. DD12]|uniref:TrmH family RNA methyltransferase n=1 Tax=Streptococcus sp. DD12 TaxID=1777880 RepID=UPI00079B354A|nr:RNA methyltransferase [Streptococcus sp. DD12]KXT75924.1 rRNA methylase [Streptococcus sp. DD12]